MNDSKISVRYAKALFKLSQEQNLVEEIKNDIVNIKNIWDDLEELRNFLESPIISTTQKMGVVQKIFYKDINRVTQSFLNLVLHNKRESYLAGMARVFIDFYKKHKNITAALITTTLPVEQKAKDFILEIIKKSYTSNVELNEQVKPEIIGGFILRIEDQQMDASVSTQLKNLKKELLNTTVKS